MPLYNRPGKTKSLGQADGIVTNTETPPKPRGEALLRRLFTSIDLPVLLPCRVRDTVSTIAQGFIS
jgi:hypothetical protein